MERKLLWSTENYIVEDEEGNFLEWDTDGMREDLLDTIKTYFSSDCILIDAHNLDWRGSCGYKVIDTDLDSRSLFNKLIPSYDCTFSIYLDYAELDTTYIYAVVSSHDVPTGGVWNLLPCKDAESVLEDIVYDIGDGSHGYNKQYFINKIDSAFPEVGIKDWVETDITQQYSLYSLDKDTRIISLGEAFTIYVDDSENLVNTIDYDLEEFKELYYKAIRG